MAPRGTGRYGGGSARARAVSSSHWTPLLFSVVSIARLTTVPLPQMWVTTTLMEPVCPAPGGANRFRLRVAGSGGAARTSSWITAASRRDGVRALWRDEDGAWRTTLRGRQVLADPRINKGTAFSDSERADLGLIGLIPAGHMTLDQQAERVYAQFLRQSSNLARNVLLNELHDRNEVLYYRVLSDHLTEMLPVI